MDSFLKKLYMGKLNPWKHFTPKDTAYWKQKEHITKMIGKWRARLREEDLGVLDELFGACLYMSELEKEEIFEYGFNMAVKLMSEAYSSKTYESHHCTLD